MEKTDESTALSLVFESVVFMFKTVVFISRVWCSCSKSVVFMFKSVVLENIVKIDDHSTCTYYQWEKY